MTVAANSVIAGPTTGNGAVDTYNYPYRVDADSHLKVRLTTILTGETEDLVLNTDYTLSGTGPPYLNGVDIVLNDPLPSTKTITRWRETPASQEIDFGATFDFAPEPVELMADKLTLLRQEVAEDVSRALKLPYQYTLPDSLFLPAPMDGRSIKWSDAEGSFVLTDGDPDEGTADALAAAAAAASSADDASDFADAASASAVAADASADAAEAAAASLGAASETVAGKVELATAAETITGTDDTRAVHPAGLAAALAALDVSTLPKGFIGGPAPRCNAAASIIIPTGCRARSSDDSADIEAVGDLTVSLASSGANGLDTGTEANDIWYYVYLIKHTDGTVAGLLSVTNEADSGSVTLPSGYTLKRQLPLAIYNNSSGDIRPFRIASGWPSMPKVRWLGTTTKDDGTTITAGSLNVLIGGTASSYTSVDCSVFVPPIAKTADLVFSSRGAVGDKHIRTDSGTANATRIEVETSGGYSVMWPDFPVTASQTFEYRSSGSQAMSFDVLGFTVTEVN